jgi:hypothetical protein
VARTEKAKSVMTDTDTLREIERGHEAKYKLGEELRFKAQCRRDKLLGLWAGKHMGMTEHESEAYAKRLVRLELEKPGGTGVVDQIMTDFKEAGVRLNEQDVIAKAARAYATALEQISRDFPKALDRDHVRVGD